MPQRKVDSEKFACVNQFQSAKQTMRCMLGIVAKCVKNRFSTDPFIYFSRNEIEEVTALYSSIPHQNRTFIVFVLQMLLLLVLLRC